jgi:hypothetical protein
VIRRINKILIVILSVALMGSGVWAYIKPNGTSYQGMLANGTIQDLVGTSSGGNDVTIGWAASNNLLFQRGGSEQWRIDGNAQILGGNNPSKIGSLTNDASDNFGFCVNSYNGNCLDNSRGASLELFGNEHASAGGATLQTGNGTGTLNIGTQGTGSVILSTNNVTRWTLDSNGYLTQGALGGEIVMSRANTFLSLNGGTIVAAGSTISDCTVIGKQINNVTTVTAGQGVCLPSPNNTGAFIIVRNGGANDMKLYPTNGSMTINGNGAGAAITLTTASKQQALCSYVAANTWICGVSTAT